MQEDVSSTLVRGDLLNNHARVPVDAPQRAFDSLSNEIRATIDRVLFEGRFYSGEEAEAFENAFASYLGAEHAVAVSSGTEALELALRVCGIGPGDRVATVSLTSIATVAAIQRTGARPILVDVDPQTLTLDPEALACLCDRIPIKAVIPVHLWGRPADMVRILEIAQRYGVIVIEDCAQAHGAKLNGRTCGTWGEAAAFSFSPTKNLCALGHGGAVVTNHAGMAEQVRSLCERSPHSAAGGNRLDALQAAVLRCKLPYLDANNARRNEIACRYNETLKDTGLNIPAVVSAAAPAYYQYVVRTRDRDAFCRHLASAGVDTAIPYESPLFLQPAFHSRNLTLGEPMPHTEAACREIVRLPLFAELTNDEVERIAHAIASFHSSPAPKEPGAAVAIAPPRRLPVSRPSIGEEELRGVAEVFESAWLGQGSKVQELEKELREMFGGRDVVAVGSGTAALHLALDALALQPGDEVIVPSLTFCATIQAITAAGATPIFCEIEPDTLNIDISDAASRITQRTKVIMPVHFCGNACNMDALGELAAHHKLLIVEDAAHAFGSSYQGRPIGSFGDITCFSFDPIKNITCGEGGAIVLSDDDRTEMLRRTRSLGMHRDRWQRSADERPWWYQVSMQGYRYHMSNISAVIGLAQLRRLPWFRRRKLELVRRYNEHFASLSGVRLLRWQLDDCAPFSYILRVTGGRRDSLHKFLAARNIDTGVNYVPNHLQPYFAKPGVALPITEQIYDEILNLPLYTDMTNSDLERVAMAVSEYFEG
ncbi:MAG TPA: DegT/DnrJ/EryC1/StrS family aminotransferase [Candidatus Angelobacter sp.]|jgi:perosamine synthetase